MSNSEFGLKQANLCRTSALSALPGFQGLVPAPGLLSSWAPGLLGCGFAGRSDPAKRPGNFSTNMHEVQAGADLHTACTKKRHGRNLCFRTSDPSRGLRSLRGLVECYED